MLFELMTLNPLFPGKNELDQIQRIHSVLGTPREDVLANFRRNAENQLKELRFSPVRGCGFSQNLSHGSVELVSLVSDLLTYEPARRPSASQVLKHKLFQRLRSEKQRDSPTTTASSPRSVALPSMKPSFPALHPQAVYKNPYLKSSPRSRSHVFHSPRGYALSSLRSPSLASYVLASARRVPNPC